MGTLTPTFNDKVKAAAPAANGSGKPHVVAAHEPLSNEPKSVTTVPILTPIISGTSGQPAAAAEPAPLKVALVGTAPSSRMLAPFNDPSWKIWACSPGNMNTLPRVDIWFEIHGNLMWPQNASYGPQYVEWLKLLNIPLYMQDNSLVPSAIPFPKDEMVRKFGPDFFTSSFAWMMAKAIDDGAKEIALYGIDMASRDEYILQRPGFYFFRYIAEQRGIKISAPNESDIMQSPALYGFSEVTPIGRKILARKKELDDRLTQMRAERDRLNHSITYLEGAREDIDYFETIWSGAQSSVASAPPA